MNAQKKGFTIVELLTVMGVIAILIGLLVPALNQVKDYAKQIQQSAQFHSIETGLEMYKTEFGEYPPSNDNLDEYDPTRNPKLNGADDQFYYTGANKLAEAMVGQDFLGFHPKSQFWSDGRAEVVNPQTGVRAWPRVYNAVNGIPQINETADENVKARGGKAGAPFLELDNANAFRMRDVYTTTPGFNTDSILSPVVLCDEYAKTRIAASGSKKTGMPILYFRARTNFTQQDAEDGLDIANDIYYYYDNYHLMNLGTAEQNPQKHPWCDTGGDLQDILDYQRSIVNQQVYEAAGIKRPYRAGSYLLISAGKDGLYGTADDINNFTRKE
ncbi:MAG: type II secretion system protein [Sedimentisphaerales bacterium]|nr:type II secretion system protein [Sedimentisphaerales bacterium]